MSFHESPLEALLDEDISTMDLGRLRAHLAAVRELRASAPKRTQMLREESESIKTRTVKKPKMDIANLF
jgi:hypothetical protein